GYGMIGIKTLSLALAVRENNAAYLAFYLSLVPLDAYFGYASAEKWNSGTFTGDKFPEKETHPLSRLWRSALIPGWGQFYSGEPLKGGLFLASFLILDTTLGSVSDKLNGVRYEKQVYNQIAPISAFVSGSDNTPSIYLSYRNLELTSLEKRYQTERGQILTLAGIFYLYNLLDAYFNSGTNPTEPEESLSFRPFLFKNEDKFLSTRDTVFGGSLEWIY
ncbi:MAG: hypothetical protein KDK54_22905, partial [Leptospiraceae bacterium]|nr:hypothetical protein [Leptospiraceae bacterium]